MWRARSPGGELETVGIVLLACCLLLMLGAFSGCEQQPELDISLLTRSPCAPPCWHNIVPGVSNEEDVRGQLENSLYVKDGSLHYSTLEEGGVPLVVFSWQDREGRPNQIYLRENRVLRIEIGLDYDLALGEIVERYGPPEGVHASVGVADFYWCDVDFDYPSLGLTLESFSLIDPEDIVEGTISVTDETEITSVVYYTPTSMRGMLREVFLFSSDQAEDFLAHIQEWDGFGRIVVADGGE